MSDDPRDRAGQFLHDLGCALGNLERSFDDATLDETREVADAMDELFDRYCEVAGMYRRRVNAAERAAVLHPAARPRLSLVP